MKNDGFGYQTPREPMTQTQIMRSFFTSISRVKFEQQFTDIESLGTGTQGEVFSAMHNDRRVAIKYFKSRSLRADSISYVKGEIQSLKQIRHENILSLFAAYQVIYNQNFKRFCIVTEFCEFTLESKEFIQTLSEIQKIRIAYQIVAGVNAIHSQAKMHRDIKSENIFIKDKASLLVKIGDFGCSRLETQNMEATRGIGTPIFRDPNVLKGPYSSKCDIYSTGLVIIELFCDKHFFTDSQNQKELEKKTNQFQSDIVVAAATFFQDLSQPQLSNSVKSLLIDVATYTLQKDEKNRASASQLLEYLGDQLTNFENYNPGMGVHQIQNEKKSEIQSNMSRKKIQSQFVELENSPVNLKKKNTFHQNFQSFNAPLNNMEKSQSESNTRDSVDKISLRRISNKQQDVNQAEEILNNSFDISQNNYRNQSFESLGEDSQNNAESPAKSQKNNQNNSFISSDSNEVEKKWNQGKGVSIKVSRNVKSSSEIIQSRINDLKSKKSIQEENLRKKRIQKKQKELTNTEKLCAQMIRCIDESLEIKKEVEAMRVILTVFDSIKKNFETVKKITEINQTPFTKKQKGVVAFFFHFMYAGKMKDLRSFVLGQQSNLKLDYVKMSSKKREIICSISEKELGRIFDNLKVYSSDLKRNFEKITPALSNLTRNYVDDAFNCMAASDFLTKVTYKEGEIKEQTRKFILEKVSIAKSEKEIEILKELCRAIGRMCQ